MLCVSVCSSSSSCVSCLVISSSSRWRTCSRVVLPIQLALPPPARPVSRPCVQMPSLLNESLVSPPPPPPPPPLFAPPFFPPYIPPPPPPKHFFFKHPPKIF